MKQLFRFDTEALRAARAQAGMSLQDVADRLGVNKSTVARWESGATTPDPQELARLMSLYGTTPDRFFPDGLGFTEGGEEGMDEDSVAGAQACGAPTPTAA